MKTFALGLIGVLLFTGAARAQAIVEDFSDRSHFAGGTAVWNQALGKIHPTLRVMNYETGFTPLDVSVGDGSNGPFDLSTYASFSQGGDVSGNIIRLDTTVHPVLNVTHFSLEPGWIIQPVNGSSQIIIESLSYVNIQGEIWCQGDDGGAASGATGGGGGAGRCGGTNGGSGGDLGFGGSPGVAADISVTGGHGGDFASTNGVGGGGGGSWNTSIAATNGPNASGSSGQAGDSSADPAFSSPLGSSGGGGGGGTSSGSGGGGGGGGGVVLIRAVGDVTIGTAPSSTTGYIFVNGGKGGNGSGDGGPGGGGGGGSVQIFSGGTIHIYNTNVAGASQALSGASGTNGNSDVGATGAGGRSWFSAVTYDLVGTYKPAEQSPVSRGNVEYSSDPEFIDTKPIDLATNGAQFLSLMLSPNSGDFTFQIAGSNDDFVMDDTGFQSDLSLIAGKRYIRMEFTITASNVNTPDMIDAAIVSFTAPNVDHFKFQAAGCGRIEDVGAGTPKTNLLLMLVTPFLLIILKLKAQRKLRA